MLGCPEYVSRASVSNSRYFLAVLSKLKWVNYGRFFHSYARHDRSCYCAIFCYVPRFARADFCFFGAFCFARVWNGGCPLYLILLYLHLPWSKRIAEVPAGIYCGLWFEVLHVYLRHCKASVGLCLGAYDALFKDCLETAFVMLLLFSESWLLGVCGLFLLGFPMRDWSYFCVFLRLLGN